VQGLAWVAHGSLTAGTFDRLVKASAAPEPLMDRRQPGFGAIYPLAWMACMVAHDATIGRPCQVLPPENPQAPIAAERRIPSVSIAFNCSTTIEKPTNACLR
jgi:hypothetical protein